MSRPTQNCPNTWCKQMRTYRERGWWYCANCRESSQADGVIAPLPPKAKTAEKARPVARLVKTVSPPKPAPSNPTLAGLPKLVSINQAAEVLGVSSKTIRRWIADQRIVAYRVGSRRIRVDTSSLNGVMRKL